MKLYLFCRQENWDEYVKFAVVAESEEQAKIFFSAFDKKVNPDDGHIEAHEITPGLCFVASNTDELSIDIGLVSSESVSA